MSVLRLALAFVAALLIPATAAASSPSIAGWALDESACASGGPTTYFFDDGVVIRSDCGDDCPSVLEGTWKQQGAEVQIRWTKHFFGKGSKRSAGPTPARTMFDEYAATFEGVAERETLTWSGPSDDDSCEAYARHDKRPNVRAFLRNELVGRYPFTSEREVTPADLASVSLEDLEIMRNEIYARYGHTFKNPRLRKHFTAQPGYRAYYTEVSAFLTPVERKNVSTILEAEKRRK